MKEVKRQATYTVEVPISFTFDADYDLDSREARELAYKELDIRLINGKFKVFEKLLEVIHKDIHRTREEKERANREWEEFLRPTKVPEGCYFHVNIFKGCKR